MQDNETNQNETVAKPGESEVEQFDVDAIPEVDIGYDDLEQSGETPEGWLLYGNNYRNQRFTVADTITPDTLSDLEREWEITDWGGDTVVEQTGGQGTPLVVPGDPPVMYHVTAPNTLRAIDARSGEILWRYTYHNAAGHVETRPPAARGPAVHGDTVYMSTLDFGLVALNRYTGDEKWYYNGAYKYRGTEISDFQGGRWKGDSDPDTTMHPELSWVRDRGSSSTYPPIVHDGVILKGSFGGEVGVAGWAEGIPTEEKLSEMDLQTEDDAQEEAGEREIRLDGITAGWEVPDDFESPLVGQESNPTLTLEAGTEYTVVWENVDGAPHNFAILTEGGQTPVSSEIIDGQGETQSVTFTASERMSTYVCEVHPQSMRGSIETGAAPAGQETQAGNATADNATTEPLQPDITAQNETAGNITDNTTDRVDDPQAINETQANETENVTAANETAPTEATGTDEGSDDAPINPIRGTEEPVGGEHNTPVWRLHMTPPDDWIGESWKHGGSTVWQAPAVDLETGRAVLPTANPGPWFGTVRPGWNPFTAGKVAVDFQTGNYQWHFQESPHDWWDYDSPNPAVIYDAEVRGEERTLVSWAGKTAWVFTMDLETGELVTRSEPFTEQYNMWDLPTRKSEGEQAADWVMPHLIGGTDPQPASYDPTTQTMVLKGTNQPMKLLWEPIEYELGMDYKGMDIITGAPEQREQLDFWENPVGNLTGIDPVTGEIKWQNWYENFLWGGVLSTASGLTFAGIADGTFRVYDTESGEELGQDEIGPGVDGNPISWVDPETGKQYVSVAAGGSRGGGGLALVTYSLQAEDGEDGQKTETN